MGNIFTMLFGGGGGDDGGQYICSLPSLEAHGNGEIAAIGFSGGSWMGSIMHVVYSETIGGSGLMNGAGYSYGFTKPLPDDMLQQTYDITA